MGARLLAVIAAGGVLAAGFPAAAGEVVARLEPGGAVAWTDGKARIGVAAPGAGVFSLAGYHSLRVRPAVKDDCAKTEDLKAVSDVRVYRLGGGDFRFLTYQTRPSKHDITTHVQIDGCEVATGRLTRDCRALPQDGAPARLPAEFHYGWTEVVVPELKDRKICEIVLDTTEPRAKAGSEQERILSPGPVIIVGGPDFTTQWNYRTAGMAKLAAMTAIDLRRIPDTTELRFVRVYYNAADDCDGALTELADVSEVRLTRDGEEKDLRLYEVAIGGGAVRAVAEYCDRADGITTENCTAYPGTADDDKLDGYFFDTYSIWTWPESTPSKVCKIELNRQAN